MKLKSLETLALHKLNLVNCMLAEKLNLTLFITRFWTYKQHWLYDLLYTLLPDKYSMLGDPEIVLNHT